MANKKKKVLIVEDEPDILDLLADSFEKEGFATLKADTAEKGIKIALQKKADFILLDILLPKMDGLTMLKKLRKNTWGKSVPVIILSNVTDQQKVSQAMELGVYDYIVKTNLVLSDLINQVKEVTS